MLFLGPKTVKGCHLINLPKAQFCSSELAAQKLSIFFHFNRIKFLALHLWAFMIWASAVYTWPYFLVFPLFVDREADLFHFLLQAPACLCLCLPWGMPLHSPHLSLSLTSLTPITHCIQSSSKCHLHHTALLNSSELLGDFKLCSHFICVPDMYMHILPSLLNYWQKFVSNLTLYLSYHLHLT